MDLLKQILDRRAAIKHLVLKNFRVRYRNMALGVLWSVLNPLVMLGVLVFVFTYLHPYKGDDNGHFPIFVLIGLVHYNIMTSILAASTLSIIEHTILVRKVAFPRIIIPLSKVLSHLVDVGVLVGLLLVFVLFSGIPLTWHALWMPVAVLVELVFILGAAFILSSLAVYYRDVMYIVESSMTMLFWLTPIFYPLSLIHERLSPGLFGLFVANPLAGCIDASRKAILNGMNPDLPSLGIAAAVAVTTLVVGIFTFQNLQSDFADYM